MDSSEVRRIWMGEVGGLGKRDSFFVCCQPILQMPTDGEGNGSPHNEKAG